MYTNWLQRKYKPNLRERFELNVTNRLGFYEGSLVRKGPNTGKYSVKFPTHTTLDEKYKGTKYGTKAEIEALIKARAIAAKKAYEVGVEKSNIKKKNVASTKFKNLVDVIFETEKFDDFKTKVPEKSKKFVLPSGNVRLSPGGSIPEHYMAEFKTAIDAGTDSKEFKALKKKLNRSTAEILKLAENYGQTDIKTRSTAATLSWPEDRKLTAEQKKEKARWTKVLRTEREKKSLKYLSERELNILKSQNNQKKVLNYFFKNNPEKILSKQFEKIRQLIDVRLTPDGEIIYDKRPDKYYIDKAKKGNIFSIFDISPVKGEKRSIRFPYNINLTPSQFNSAFIKQLESYYPNLDGAKQKIVQKFLADLGIVVEVNGQRIGSTEKLPAIGKNGQLPNILRTLNALKVPNKLKTIALGGAVTVTAMSSALAGDNKVSEEDQSFADEIAGGATVIGTDLAINKARVSKWALDKFGKVVAPLAMPGVQGLYETGKAIVKEELPDAPDLSNPLTWMTPAFWSWGVKQWGFDKTLENFGKSLSHLSKGDKTRVIRNLVARGFMKPEHLLKIRNFSIPWIAATTVGKVFEHAEPNLLRDEKGDPLVEPDKAPFLLSEMIKAHDKKFLPADVYKKEHGDSEPDLPDVFKERIE